MTVKSERVRLQETYELRYAPHGHGGCLVAKSNDKVGWRHTNHWDLKEDKFGSLKQFKEISRPRKKCLDPYQHRPNYGHKKSLTQENDKRPGSGNYYQMKSNGRVAVGVSDVCVVKVWVTSSGSEDCKVEDVPRSSPKQETVPAVGEHRMGKLAWLGRTVQSVMILGGAAEVLCVHPDMWLIYTYIHVHMCTCMYVCISYRHAQVISITRKRGWPETKVPNIRRQRKEKHGCVDPLWISDDENGRTFSSVH